MVSSVHFSSKSDDWSTPQDFFNKVNAEFGPFDLDPCATVENAKAPKFYTTEEDGYVQPWHGRVFCNPPYNKPEKVCASKCSKKRCDKRGWHRTKFLPGTFDWVARGLCEIEMTSNAELVVFLIPARTDTAGWHKYVTPFAHEIRFIKGRLKFGNAKHAAPFPSALAVFRRDK